MNVILHIKHIIMINIEEKEKIFQFQSRNIVATLYKIINAHVVEITTNNKYSSTKQCNDLNILLKCNECHWYTIPSHRIMLLRTMNGSAWFLNFYSNSCFQPRVLIVPCNYFFYCIGDSIRWILAGDTSKILKVHIAVDTYYQLKSYLTHYPLAIIA